MANFSNSFSIIKQFFFTHDNNNSNNHKLAVFFLSISYDSELSTLVPKQLKLNRYANINMKNLTAVSKVIS